MADVLDPLRAIPAAVPSTPALGLTLSGRCQEIFPGTGIYRHWRPVKMFMYVGGGVSEE